MTVIRPLFALFNRSLREQSRTKFTSVARAAIVLLILLFVFLNQRSFVNNPAPGLEVLMILVMVNFFAITIFGLSTFSSAITEEKEEETLGLLRMTRLNPLAILLGKSTARLFDGFLLLGVQVPFTMLCVTLGGVAQSQILRSYAVLAAYLFFLCNAALLWSVVCRRTSRATVMTVITGLAVYVLPLFLLVLALSSRFNSTNFPGRAPVGQWYEKAIQWVLSINPLFDLTKTVQPRIFGIPFTFTVSSITPSLLMGTVCFGLAWLLFGPCCNTTAEAVARRPVKAAGGASLRRLRKSRPGRRAIAWKDFHFLGGGYEGLVVRTLVYAGLLGSFLWWAATVGGGHFSTSDEARILCSFGLIAFSIEFGLAGARFFGIERKRKTLGGLYILPSGTARLIGLKVLGTLPVFIPSVVIYSVGIFLMLSGGSAFDWNRFRFFPTLASLAFTVSEYILFAVLVAFLSLRMRRAALASALAIMFFGNLLAGKLIGLFIGRGSFWHPDMVLLSLFALWVWILVLAAAIPRQVARAAAEE